MNKSELVSVLAERVGVTKAEADRRLADVLGVMSETLKKGESIQLVGFGSLKVVESAARKGRNPQTGKPLNIAASKKVKFNVSSEIKTALNTKKKPGKKK